MVCEAAPPSDHERKVYAAPPTVCGETTPIVRGWPTTPGMVVPAATGPPSSISWNPAGLLASVSRAVLGWTSTKLLPVAPFESATVRMTRYHTSGDVSAKSVTNDPPVTAVNVRNGW